MERRAAAIGTRGTNPLALARRSEPHLTAHRRIAIGKNAAPPLCREAPGGVPLAFRGRAGVHRRLAIDSSGGQSLHMPPRPRPPRLWLRPARPGRGAAYFFLDRGQQHATRTADSAEAEKYLARYITEKHTARIAHGKRDTEQIPVLDVRSTCATLLRITPSRTGPRDAWSAL
jgi:hypothetical protein